MTLQEMFDATKGEFLKFERIENKLSQRADVHAFMLLDKLVPGDRDLICASEHDEFYIDIDHDDLAKVATLETVRELTRCGVRLNTDVGGLCMFA